MNASNAESSIRNWILVQPKPGFVLRGTLLRFDGRSGAFEVFPLESVFKPGQIIEGAQIEVPATVALPGPVCIGGVVDTGLSSICEFSLVEEAGQFSLCEQGDSSTRKEALSSFLDRWKSENRLLPEYRLLVSEMASLFGGLNAWLFRQELQIQSDSILDPAVLREVARELGPQTIAAIDGVWEGFHKIADRIPPSESHHYMAYLRHHLQPFLMVSPFAHRSFTKPLGYAGDYECVNMIERDPYEGRSLFAMIINYWLLQQLPSVAHRSRIDYLENSLMQEVARVRHQGHPLRVFNLGCGPAIEIQRFLRGYEVSSNAEFTLLDFSRETLDYTGRVLSELKQAHGRKTKFRYIESSVRKLLRQASGTAGPGCERYDFIYCAGLFDYLPDAVCLQLLELLYEWLEPGGLLLSTNVETTRAIELSLEYMLDWKLICRSQTEFALVAPRQAAADCIRIVGVDQGYNLFLEVRKN